MCDEESFGFDLNSRGVMSIDGMHFGLLLVVPSIDEEGHEESEDKITNASSDGEGSDMLILF